MELPEEEVKQSAPEVIPEPEGIQEARKIVQNITKLIDSGELEELSCYVAHRNGEYLTYQSRNNGRHEDAGRIFELAMFRLGFVQRHEIEALEEE